MSGDEITLFPTTADFDNEKPEERKPIVKWREVPLGVYMIEKHFVVPEGKYGPNVRLQLKDSNGQRFEAWACSRLAEAFQEGPARYILNEGLMPSTIDPTRQYFSYKLKW